MSARFITKCPSCDRITSDCIDSSLSEPRTEFDGCRCKRCTKHKRQPGHAETPRGFMPWEQSRKRMAIHFSKWAGVSGIR